MLGLAPDSRGLLPDCDVARLKEFGEALSEREGNNLALNMPRFPLKRAPLSTEIPTRSGLRRQVRIMQRSKST